VLRLLLASFLLFFQLLLAAQGIEWAPAGHSYYALENDAIVQYDLPELAAKTIAGSAQLRPAGASKPLALESFQFSADNRKLLLYTNSERVWRYNTRGDYWVLDLVSGSLTQLGKGLPESSLMFAKFSPDGARVAYVSQRNLYVEELPAGKITRLTETDGTPKLINGTFDWVYEEEFDCRDGFRWCPDSKRIAYWQIDANQIRDFYMINTTDSIYAFNVPVEYPKVGEPPSPYKIGVVDIKSKKTTWMQPPGDPRQTYLPRMEWLPNGAQLMLQQLNRKQNQSTLFLCDAKTGACTATYQETDEAWIDLQGGEMTDYFKWMESGKSFLWTSEKDGWRHVYRVSRDGKEETLLTKGKYDVISVSRIDEDRGYLYFMASPENATQSYLWRVRLDGSSREPERLSPPDQTGAHAYSISPDARYARHNFTNYYTPRATEWITLPDHAPLDPAQAVAGKVAAKPPANHPVEMFQVTTTDGVTLDGWLVKPKDFDPKKKYPILFYVYGEPASATVRDAYGVGANRQYEGDMAADGYIYASLDGRGTPAPKGRAWRKAIYRKIGVVNIRDQAMGAKAMFERWNWIDTSRVAVWGWSGGGSSTLNCLFQYPEIYKTGIAVAAVANQLTYDNIYQERYMGLPQENKEDFLAGSPVTHAKNLQGNLLYIHGTGDDNVHYQNAEMLVNELIRYNKYFQFMPYPNRSHGIGEGEGTRAHLRTMFTKFLKTHCPPGGR
jgi:dipeptidyl-peptidase-4